MLLTSSLSHSFELTHLSPLSSSHFLQVLLPPELYDSMTPNHLLPHDLVQHLLLQLLLLVLFLLLHIPMWNRHCAMFCFLLLSLCDLLLFG